MLGACSPTPISLCAHPIDPSSSAQFGLDCCWRLPELPTVARGGTCNVRLWLEVYRAVTGLRSGQEGARHGDAVPT